MLILLVIASRSDVYDQMVQEYWVPFIRHMKNAPVKIFLLFGAHQNPEQLVGLDPENVMVFDQVVENLVPGICLKTLLALELVNAAEYKYKHVLRTNLSSVFEGSKLLQLSESLPDHSVYAGILGVYKNISFVSGAGIWLSRDQVDALVAGRDQIVGSALFDDVVFATILKPPSFYSAMARHDICYDETFRPDHVDLVDRYYHFRIKNKNRQLDIQYMKAFAARLLHGS